MRKILTILLFCLSVSWMQAQITIGGSVYGGGNAGDMTGNTSVTVRAGDLNRVYGGARMANVGGRTFMNIDGAHASNYIVINRLYGGNDISGTIGTSNDELPDAVKAHAANNGVDKSWNALVLISSKMTPAVTYTQAEIDAAQEGDDAYGKTTDDIKTPATIAGDNKPIYIGQLFGGGDGEYEYGSRQKTTGEGDEAVTTTVYYAKEDKVEVATSNTPLSVPDLGKTFVDIHGGSIVYAYGGGNNATVTEKTVISMDNPSEVVSHITDADNPNADDTGEVLTNERFEKKMGINTTFSYPSSDAYQIGRLFGGNNKADMAIRPQWNLQRGKVRNLYSGGNEGRMTSPEGLLLQIEGAGMVIDNVYGGCRKSDVRPLDAAGNDVANDQIQLESNPTGIPAGFAARTRILGGNVNNVYGGNDISGNVYGGNTVAILTTVHGNVYGGGNGSYAYTDNPALKEDSQWRDFYYNPKEILGLSGDTFTGMESAKALNKVRPNAEQVSLLLRGTKEKPVFVEGSVYVGGNSASLQELTKTEDLADQTRKVEIKIGSYVTVDNVFLGNNGENMVRYNERVDYGNGSFLPEGVLRTMANTTIAGSKFNSMNLTDDAAVFSKYMEGCAMKVIPRVVFDDIENYDEYTTYFGSFYCGGNVGSMLTDGLTEISFKDKVVIYNKVVGGCNQANVDAVTGFRAAYQGGLLGDPDGNGDKLKLNFAGLKIQPKRWKIIRDASYEPVLAGGKEQYDLDAKGNRQLEWNTIDSRTYDPTTKKYKPMASIAPAEVGKTGFTPYDASTDLYRRFLGGNIYGGCYTSGHVNGNVIINLNASLVDRTGDEAIFDEVDEVEGEAKLYDGNYNIKKRYTGVLLGEQGMDVLGRALNVFGGGYGADSEIWGSTTINLNKGYTFQIFGGGEQGAIGKANGSGSYEYDPTYSTYINLKDEDKYPGTYRGDTDDKDHVVDHVDMAEAEFIYGGSFEGLITGNTHINLGNGRIFNSFAGSCNADILGHTETYVGRNSNDDDDLGFPWVRDHIYGGNDLGGRILGSDNFMSRVNPDFQGKVYNPKGKTVSETDSNPAPDVVKASAYTEYIQGRVEYIFGGCYGDYDYTDPHYKAYTYTTDADDKTESNLGKVRTGFSKPWMDNAFVNFKPNSNNRNAVAKIYGAGEGHTYAHASDADRDQMQDRSYVLIDATDQSSFTQTEVFGAGDYSGVGMRYKTEPTTIGETTIPALTPAIAKANGDGVTASTVIDLMRGHVKAIYGGSYQEGTTRRTIVNVPVGSTIHANSIFGGAYGRIDEVTTNAVTTKVPRIDLACDVYEAIVNYHSDDAIIDYALYGGNNACRRTLYGQVNVTSPVWSNKTKGYTATVYGAGCGVNTWSQYTEVNLNKKPDDVVGDYTGAQVYEAYGGGEDGQVLNTASVTKWKDTQTNLFTALPEGYTDPGLADGTPANSNKLHEVDASRPKYYNTNVHINHGATVAGYCYGGGLGHGDIAYSGNVYGTTYIDLLGGKVVKDLYAAGTTGSVKDSLGVKGTFIASSTAYIEGGSARNVYGGGWKGSVGHHEGLLDASYYNSSTGELIDIPGETHVVIGILKDKLATAPAGDAHYHLYHGIPYIERNAYGGGEGGAVWGSTHITLNNGYIGYIYNPNGTDNAKTANIDERYEEKIEDDTYTDDVGHIQENKRLNDAGCIFGGGYVDNSNVDFTHVTMYGGHVRNALFGGGEIAAVGRGKIHESMVEGQAVRVLQGIYRPGGTELKLYDGHVHRNVFGGGRGYNNLGESGKLFTDGYVFGQTRVYVYGGEIGTEKELMEGHGNVFGGGDIGYVYSAYEYTDASGHKLPRKGVKDGVRYDGDGMYQGYYYEHDWADGGNFVKYLGGVESSSGNERKLTEDCKVLIEPHCKVIANSGVSYTIKYAKGQVLSEDDLEYLQSTNSNLLNSSIDAYGKVTVTDGISITRSFNKGDYVPTSALNTLGNKMDSEWTKLEANGNDDGIIIHNAVFAGGNTSSQGSDDVNAFANSTSVLGNATASIHDAYHRDLITIGTGHIGGLYGDGNLTLVDGYRGLNITNYGTDYYYLYDENKWTELTIGQYNNLLDREKDYYELRYKCVQSCKDDDGTLYRPAGEGNSKASTLTADDILTLFAKQNGENGTVNMFSKDDDGNTIPNPAYWVQNGVCSIYAGRILNTIQRADFCGVFGSRMVMQGAQDRVPEVVDYTKYTINRVREVSLNKKNSIIDADADDADHPTRKMHGNYFGIYSVVNFLGALTSDVDFGDQGKDSDTDDAAGRVTNSDGSFSYLSTKGDVGTGDVRTSDNINTGTYGPQYEGQTFYGWKRFHKDDRERNNGNSHNKVALASGVYLELTTEESFGKDLYEKVWGPITGVVELDLINMQQGIGGGFVYAKNIHGKRTKTNRTNTTLTALNAGAVTRWDYTYEEPSTTSNDEDLSQRYWQTSGNFVHSTQTIIDDCYNVSNKYKGPDRVPAHYWYIKGSVYVYDQYISAYTGATNAYSEMVDIPLTITAASHGNMKLLNVQPNRYAYYNTNNEKLSGEQRLIINDIEYMLNDPIAYWEWNKLTPAERRLFVPATMVCIADGTVGGEHYKTGDVILPVDTTNVDNQKVGTLANGDRCYWGDILRPSNNLSHETGYILTYQVNNPTKWDTWYTEYADAAHDATKAREKVQDETGLAAEYDAGHVKRGPNEGPTYHLISNIGSVLGQRRYEISDLISEDVETTYKAMKTANSSAVNAIGGQATFARAYVVTAQTNIERGGQTVHLYPGSTLSATEAEGASNVAEAFICTKTIKLSGTDNIYINSVMTSGKKNDYLADVDTDIKKLVDEINLVLTTNNIAEIEASTITDISTLTTAQLNKITALQKKNLSELLTKKKDITNNIVPAYYCTEAGLYGGNYYQGGINYRGMEAWSSMSEEDRAKFEFNYDALDLLVDKNYGGTEGEKYQYDSSAATLAAAQANLAGYSREQHVDYTATYNGDNSINLTTNGLSAIHVKRGNDTDYSTSTTTIERGDELSREVYESLPNEQRHYTPLTVTSADVQGEKTCTFYVVKTPLMIGSIPYTVGNLISKDDYEGLYSTDPQQNEQGKVEVLEYTVPGTYYFCREAYDNVTVGTVISSDEYLALTNLQKGFTIHGISPTETSTLYVSRFSDIDDLSSEKIITVIYQYDYEESDVSGLHITPVTERHVLNIHVKFKTGAPIVEDIIAPQMIIPGDYLGLNPPNVIEGASPIQGGGWELYETESDADKHNGVTYTPNVDPLYWYQHGYWLRYYALSYIGGKTYSNKVQVSVANYHDLKKVMEDKAHHYYIDIPDLVRLRRDPKIYINDGTDGMNQLKNLFNLSLLNSESEGVANGVVTTEGALKDHALLNPQVSQCENLEFIMRTNVNHTGSWTPIAAGTNNTDPCFSGNLHGDGHTISGLSQSLFGKLCGNVYNLGVIGSFTSAGVADTGDGYVENCWINTTGTPANGVKAVFGSPTASGYKRVNCYYPETLTYNTQSDGHGLARPMPDEAFYNGTVAYDLNGFYLFKRYWDHQDASGSEYKDYKYYSGETDPTTGKLIPKTEYYGSNVTYCSSGVDGVYAKGGYVENRYADGDFRYAGGEIPLTVDERLYTDTEGKVEFYPIWPDDYLFFGQMLTYGWDPSAPHEEVPSPIVKDGGRLLDTNQSNRVNRAPAYYRSKDMDVFHFNPWAHLAAYSAPKTITDTNLKSAYPNMTAVDFAGHYDNTWTLGPETEGFVAGGSVFYPPVLDNDGLIGVANHGETPNLLVYAPEVANANDEVNQKTNDVLSDYFIGTEEERTEPVYNHFTESGNKYTDGKDYDRVAIANTSSIHGHLVQGDLTTVTDHLLVDKEDFYCPIEYKMGDDYRMWYQREPKNFVTTVWTNAENPQRTTQGWDGISLPFSAELVTTQDKGEITHFYSGSRSSKNDTETKIGHEYWLRELQAGGNPVNDVYYANLNYPASDPASGETISPKKTVGNTFLWDYYYEAPNDPSSENPTGHNLSDANADKYPTDYYATSRSYTNYQMLSYNTPYLIGFPSDTFYEFDLSGTFEATTTATPKPAKLPAQTVTFVSKEGATIACSDVKPDWVNPQDGYAFKANFLKQEVPANGGYLLNAAGDSYDKVTDKTAAVPFRPYFIVSSGSGAKRRVAEKIVFDMLEIAMDDEEEDDPMNDTEGRLIISGKKQTIVVSSSLRKEVFVRIVNLSGLIINTFTLQPGESIDTPVPAAGVYIVQAANGKYRRKVAVK